MNVKAWLRGVNFPEKQHPRIINERTADMKTERTCADNNNYKRTGKRRGASLAGGRGDLVPDLWLP